MADQSPVRLGTIGFGIMGERLMGAARAHEPSALTVSGAWDPAEAAMRRLSETFPDVEDFQTLDTLLAASDCVHIASPPSFHLDQLEQAVDAGCAVLCEKPLAVDVDRAERTLKRMLAKGARAAVNFPFASSFAVEQLDAWRDEGAIGDVQEVEIEIGFAAWPRPWQRDAAAWLDKRAEGGFVREVVSHFLFLTLRQLGPITLERFSCDYPGGDDSETSVSAVMEAGGVPVTLSGRVGGTDKPDHNLWTLKGSAGQIRLRDWAVAERLAPDGSWRETPDARPNEEMRPLIMKRQLDKVAAMTRGEPHDLATIDEAFRVQMLVERILAE